MGSVGALGEESIAPPGSRAVVVAGGGDVFFVGLEDDHPTGGVPAALVNRPSRSQRPAAWMIESRGAIGAEDDGEIDVHAGLDDLRADNEHDSLPQPRRSSPSGVVLAAEHLFAVRGAHGAGKVEQFAKPRPFRTS